MTRLAAEDPFSEPTESAFPCQMFAQLDIRGRGWGVGNNGENGDELGGCVCVWYIFDYYSYEKKGKELYNRDLGPKLDHLGSGTKLCYCYFWLSCWLSCLDHT